MSGIPEMKATNGHQPAPTKAIKRRADGMFYIRIPMTRDGDFGALIVAEDRWSLGSIRFT